MIRRSGQREQVATDIEAEVRRIRRDDRDRAVDVQIVGVPHQAGSQGGQDHVAEIAGDRSAAEQGKTPARGKSGRAEAGDNDRAATSNAGQTGHRIICGHAAVLLILTSV